jgi:hypothetical protein
VGCDHGCFFIGRVVERLDVRLFEHSCSAGGRAIRATVDAGVMALHLGAGHHQHTPDRAAAGEGSGVSLSDGNQVDIWAMSAFRRCHCLASAEVGIVAGA